MFISKAEKEGIKDILVETTKSMRELKKRIFQLEETVALMRRIDQPEVASIPTPIKVNVPVVASVQPDLLKGKDDYFGFFKTPEPKRKKRSTSPTPVGSMSMYAYPFVENLQVGQTVEIPATQDFSTKRLSSTVTAHLGQRYGRGNCSVRADRAHTKLTVVRIK